MESHKFIPVYGSTTALDAMLAAVPTLGDHLERAGANIGGDSSISIHPFPFGIAVFHIREVIEFPGIAWLAAWRKATYHHCRVAIDAMVQEIEGAGTTEYVFSVYDVLRHPWNRRHLHSAMRLVSMPSTLLPKTNHWDLQQRDVQRAHDLEQGLIAQGFSNSEIEEFGISGISLGCASWSAVAYHAIAPEQRLATTSLVNIELLTQALWHYCNTAINSGNNEATTDPSERDIDPYIHRLIAPSQPEETTDECLAREAIVRTSRIKAMLELMDQRSHSPRRPML